MNTLLLVEDEENDVFLFKRAMQKSGVHLNVQVASDGHQAIQYLSGAGPFADRSQYPLPDLVLLDLNLPRVKGLEVLRWIRSQSRLRVVVVILTSSQSEDDLDQAYALGANSFLVKPADTSRLTTMLQALYTYWFEVNRAPQILPPMESGKDSLP